MNKTRSGNGYGTMINCSLKKWVCNLPWMQQGVLFGAIRNCDGHKSDNTPYKTLIRGIRATCIKSAQCTGSFNARRPSKSDIYTATNDFCNNYIDALPLHFVTHLMQACEVIGYSHPQEKIADVWFDVYKQIVHTIHLNIEYKNDFVCRLSDDLEQVKRENQHDENSYKNNDYNFEGTINEVY